MQVRVGFKVPNIILLFSSSDLLTVAIALGSPHRSPSLWGGGGAQDQIPSALARDRLILAVGPDALEAAMGF